MCQIFNDKNYIFTIKKASCENNSKLSHCQRLIFMSEWWIELNLETIFPSWLFHKLVSVFLKSKMCAPLGKILLPCCFQNMNTFSITFQRKYFLKMSVI